jgi:erythrin-vacuolar iron transport family protein
MFNPLRHPRREFASLDEREILALAVAAEEEDGRIYGELALKLAPTYPGTAAIFEGMAAEEDEHRRRLLDLYVEKFGTRLAPIRRENVRGFIHRKPVWLMQNLTLDTARQLVWEMEEGAYRFYMEAAKQCSDAAVRKLLGDLAVEERRHADAADRLDEANLGAEGRRDRKDRGAPAVPPHLCAARSRRPDGWLGIDAGAGLRRRLRHRQHLGDLPCRRRRLGGRRHLNGLHRSRRR